MKYLYDSHMGGLYTSDEELDYDHLYCETCGDSDMLLGSFTTIQDFWNLIKDECNINGSGGYILQYVYPILVSEFDLPDDVQYENDYERDCGFCCNDEREILARIEELVKGTNIDYLDTAQDKIDKYFKEHALPDYFFQCFFGELIKVLGIKGLIPDKYYDVEYDDEGNIIESNCEDYSYKNQLDYYLSYMCGTAGWHMAFEESCRECKLIDVYKYYFNLDWIESDIFDSYVAEEMLNVIFSDDIKNNYYNFKLNIDEDDE